MENHRKYLERQRHAYDKIGEIPCPALRGEFVYFNCHGFRHLLRKSGRWRGFMEQKERFDLLKYVELIIKDPNIDITTKVSSNRQIPSEFYCLQKKFGNKNFVDIKVILRKIKQGKIHFYSIFKVK